MCKVFAVASQKGGVGKTTTAINLGVALVYMGYKVLLVDADAQGSLTASLGFTQPDRLDDTLASVMEKEINEEEYDPRRFGILGTKELVDILPCNIELAGLEVSMVGVWNREKSNVTKDNRDVELKQLMRRRQSNRYASIARAYMEYIESHSMDKKESENNAV